MYISYFEIQNFRNCLFVISLVSLRPHKSNACYELRRYMHTQIKAFVKSLRKKINAFFSRRLFVINNKYILLEPFRFQFKLSCDYYCKTVADRRSFLLYNDYLLREKK